MLNPHKILEEISQVLLDRPNIEDYRGVEHYYGVLADLTSRLDRVIPIVEQEVNQKHYEYLQSLDPKGMEWNLVKNSSTKFNDFANRYAGDVAILLNQLKNEQKLLSSEWVGYNTLLSKLRK